jgi:predicted metal-binding protein
MKMKNKIIKLLSEIEYLDTREIRSSQLVFEEKVRLKCSQCMRYGVNWSCPPKIPQLDYPRIISECDNLIFLYCSMPFNESDFETIRAKSTNLLHRSILSVEQLLWNSGFPLSISFIGGSCKICPEGCDPVSCRHPDKMRIPLEATGVNVVKSAENVGLKIVFPPVGFLLRVGLMGW